MKHHREEHFLDNSAKQNDHCLAKLIYQLPCNFSIQTTQQKLENKCQCTIIARYQHRLTQMPSENIQDHIMTTICVNKWRSVSLTVLQCTTAEQSSQNQIRYKHRLISTQWFLEEISQLTLQESSKHRQKFMLSIILKLMFAW